MTMATPQDYCMLRFSYIWVNALPWFGTSKDECWRSARNCVSVSLCSLLGRSYQKTSSSVISSAAVGWVPQSPSMIDGGNGKAFPRSNCSAVVEFNTVDMKCKQAKALTNEHRYLLGQCNS